MAVSPDRRADLEDTMEMTGCTVSMVSGNDPAMFGLPFRSVKAPNGTLIVPGVWEFKNGVNVAEYDEPDPANEESFPPATTTSSTPKEVEDLLSMKVMLAVRAERSTGRSVVIATDGSTVSIKIGLVSDPAVLLLPAASLKVPAATEMVPDVMELAVGVKVAM
jgi:hypothetical protein